MTSNNLIDTTASASLAKPDNTAPTEEPAPGGLTTQAEQETLPAAPVEHPTLQEIVRREQSLTPAAMNQRWRDAHTGGRHPHGVHPYGRGPAGL